MPKKGDLLTFKNSTKKEVIWINDNKKSCFGNIASVVYLEEFTITIGDYSNRCFKCFCVDKDKVEFVTDFSASSFL